MTNTQKTSYRRIRNLVSLIFMFSVRSELQQGEFTAKLRAENILPNLGL